MVMASAQWRGMRRHQTEGGGASMAARVNGGGIAASSENSGWRGVSKLGGNK